MALTAPPQAKQKKTRRFKGPVKLTAFLALISLLVLVAMPHVLRLGLTRWLHDAGVGKAEIEDVDFNPFLGRVVLKTVRLSNQDQVGFEAGEMALTFAWWPLWSGRFKVKNLRVEDGSFAFRHLPAGNWRIGGIPLGAAPASTGSEDTVATAVNSWGVGAETITMQNMVVSFHEWHWQEECTLVGARLENLATWEQDSAGSFAVRVSRGEGTLNLAGEIKPFGSEPVLQAKVKLQRLPLNVLAPLLAGEETVQLQGEANAELVMQVTSDQNHKTFHYESRDTLHLNRATYQSSIAKVQPMDLRWQGRSSGDLSGETFAVTLAGSLSGNPLGLDLTAVPYQIGAARLALEGEVHVSRSGTDRDRVDITYLANGSAEGVQLHDPANGLNLVRLSGLNVQALQGTNGTMGMEKVEGRGLELLQRGKAKELSKSQQAYTVVVNEVTLDDLTVTEQGLLSIEKVRLQDGEGVLVRNRLGEMEFGQGQTAASVEPQEPGKTVEGGGMRIGSLHLTGQNRIVFEDHFPILPFKETFESVTLEVGLLDSRQPQLQTPVTLQSGIGGYAALVFTGTISPFAPATTMDLKGTLSSIDLPSLNPYADQYLSYRLESGQLDADIVLKVDDGVMDSEAHLLLEKLKVKKVREGEDRFQQISGFPFQYTVDLLRDKKDDIRFRLPVKGDMRSPDFQLDDVVTKALAGAAKKAVVSYFTPLGVTLLTGVSLPMGTLYVSGKIVDWATLLHFKPVVFALGSAELSEENLLYLDSIEKLLSDRPKVRVVLCGKATVAELTNGAGTSGKPLPEEAGDISPQEKLILLELAGSRAHRVKEYLVARGIEAKRLIICEPGIDSTPAGGARVEMAI